LQKKNIIPQNSDNFGKEGDMKYFAYRNHSFICYQKNGNFYFDVQHIISVLNLKKSSWADKYNEFYDNIKYYKFYKNEYGGYILRELIDEQTTYQIILSSNSVLSKSFKKDVSKILANLRKQGQLNVSNDKITLNKKSYKSMNESNDKIIGDISYPIYTYNNLAHTQFVRHLKNLSANIPLAKFANKHVLYAFVIPIKTNHNDIILIFGYSEDIFQRIEDLKSEYGSKVYLINIKIISGQKDEERFHNIMKKKYDSLIESYSIKNKKKVELYKFSPILLKEFDDYLNQNNSCNLISEYIDLELSLQNNPFNLIHSYEYLMAKEKNHHEKIMKQYDLEITKLKYQNIKKDIQLIKAQTELASVSKSDIYTSELNKHSHNPNKKQN
jgi:prophage antirepressor-like protein